MHVDTEILCVFTSKAGEKVPENKGGSGRNQPNTRHSNTLIEISCPIERIQEYFTARVQRIRTQQRISDREGGNVIGFIVTIAHCE